MNPPAQQDVPGDNGSVSTVAVDVLEQECIVSFNVYYDPVGPGKRELKASAENPRATAEECCTSCHALPECNAWQWCPLDDGCVAPAHNSSSASGSFSRLGCQLLQLEGFSPYVVDTSFFKAQGPDIPFVAGAPVNLILPQLPGYDIMAGADLEGQFDYECTDEDGSQDQRCMLRGDAKTLSALCGTDPACQAFVYFPRGLSLDDSGAVGVLKSAGANGAISRNSTFSDPAAAVYFKQPVAAASGEQGGSTFDSSAVVAAVVASVFGVVFLSGAIALALYTRKYRGWGRSFPEGPVIKAEDAGVSVGAGPGSGMPGSGAFLDTASYSTSGGSGSASMLQRAPSGGAVWSGSGPAAPPSGAAAPLAVSPFASGFAQPGPGPSANGMRHILVSELPPEVQLSQYATTIVQLAGSMAPGSNRSPSGSTARELLDIFSQMYRQHPRVDPEQLAEMLENEQGGAGQTSAEQQQQQVAGTAVTTAPAPALVPMAASPQGDTDDGFSISPEDIQVSVRPDGSWWTLGAGAFGTVYRGLYRGSQSVAVKVLHHLEEPRRTEGFLHEAALLRTLRHDHVVQFLGACMDGPQGMAMLVTELMELGDLWRALPVKSATSGVRIFSWQRRGHRVMLDVAKGLHYLHCKRVVHLDLKSANILLSHCGTAKIADVGMARVLNKSCLSVLSGMGTFAWSAPEVLSGRRCTEKVDIYSWGVVLWEVCTGQAPVRGDMRPLRVPEDCPAEVAQLHARCTAEEPDQRPTAEELVQCLEALSLCDQQ